MANTYTLISSATVGSGGASSIDFTSIPNTYTDLCLLASIRTTNSAGNGSVRFGFNNTSNTTNWALVFIEGDGSTAQSYSSTQGTVGYPSGGTATTDTFGNLMVYVSNYLSSEYKGLSADSVGENNSTTAISNIFGEVWQNTAAITAINLTPGSGSFAQYSTAYLYGIKNS